MHAATTFLGSHTDLLAGAVCDSRALVTGWFVLYIASSLGVTRP